MNKKGLAPVAAAIAVIFFFAALYSINYQLPNENTIYLNRDGFNIYQLTLNNGNFLNVYNNDTISRRVIVEGIESPIIQPNQYIKYRFINSGKIVIEIRDIITSKKIIEITIN